MKLEEIGDICKHRNIPRRKTKRKGKTVVIKYTGKLLKERDREESYDIEIKKEKKTRRGR